MRYSDAPIAPRMAATMSDKTSQPSDQIPLNKARVAGSTLGNKKRGPKKNERAKNKLAQKPTNRLMSSASAAANAPSIGAVNSCDGANITANAPINKGSPNPNTNATGVKRHAITGMVSTKSKNNSAMIPRINPAMAARTTLDFILLLL